MYIHTYRIVKNLYQGRKEKRRSRWNFFSPEFKGCCHSTTMVEPLVHLKRKCNLPINPYLRLLGGRFLVWSVGLSIFIFYRSTWWLMPCNIRLGRSTRPSCWSLSPPPAAALSSSSLTQRVAATRYIGLSFNWLFGTRSITNLQWITMLQLFLNFTTLIQGEKLMQKFQWLLNPRQVFDLSQSGPLPAIELYKRVPGVRFLACGGDGTVGWVLSVLDQVNIPTSKYIL